MLIFALLLLPFLIRKTFLDTRVSFIFFVSREFVKKYVYIYINENWNTRGQICKKFSSGSLDTILYIFIEEKNNWQMSQTGFLALVVTKRFFLFCSKDEILSQKKFIQSIKN